MINAFQHIGMGVWDIDKTFSFYKDLLGFKVKLNDITLAPKEMEPVLGKVETMRVMMALNVKGGGAVEFVEYKSTPIGPLPEDCGYGNYGVLEIGIGVCFIEKVVEYLESRDVGFLTPVCSLDFASGIRWKYAYLLDPNGLRIQLVEDIRPGDEKPKKSEIQGVVHVGLGVSDMDRSIAFYSDNLGFDRTLFSFTGHMPEMDPVTGSPQEMKTTILERCAPVSRVASLLRPGIIKLFEVPGRKGTHIFANRRWGDMGCMEFCMDVFDLEGTINALKGKGIKPYLKPVNVDMGSGSRGKVAYIRDPDKTIIEFVEIETIAWLSTPLFMKIAMPLLKIYDSMTKSPGLSVV